MRRCENELNLGRVNNGQNEMNLNEHCVGRIYFYCTCILSDIIEIYAIILKLNIKKIA